MDNIIIADFSESRDVIASGRYQYDYGQIYKPVGVELPETYEVHFGNEFVNESFTVLGNADGALVPDVLFTTGLNILAWIFLHDGTEDGRTVYRAYIPIARRSAVTDTPPTPEEQSAISQAIALMQEYLERMPTKTSDLVNDGDGSDDNSPFATVAYVDAHGGGGGTSNYNALINKPLVEGYVLEGDKTFKQLGLDTCTQAEVEAVLYLP